MAVAPLVVDATCVIVSCFHGRPASVSASPPHRSTTGRPPTYTATDAPDSPGFPAKLARNASAPWPQPSSTCPFTSVLFMTTTFAGPADTALTPRSQCKVYPPSTTTTDPVMKLDASDVRNTTV